MVWGSAVYLIPEKNVANCLAGLFLALTIIYNSSASGQVEFRRFASGRDDRETTPEPILGLPLPVKEPFSPDPFRGARLRIYPR
jgi:hypothetical protein